MEALGRRGGEKVGDVFVEEYLRDLWERTRAPSRRDVKEGPAGSHLRDLQSLPQRRNDGV